MTVMYYIGYHKSCLWLKICNGPHGFDLSEDFFSPYVSYGSAKVHSFLISLKLLLLKKSNKDIRILSVKVEQDCDCI